MATPKLLTIINEMKKSVSTWAVDGTGRTIVPPIPPVGFPTRGSEYLPSSPCQWTYTGGPPPGGKPETFLRNRRRMENRSWRLGRFSKSRRETGRLTPFGAGHRPGNPSAGRKPKRRANQKLLFTNLVAGDGDGSRTTDCNYRENVFPRIDLAWLHRFTRWNRLRCVQVARHN